MEQIKLFLKTNFPILVKLKHTLIKSKHTIRSFFGKKLEYLEVNITDHCNLKCNGCTHFSNISQEKFIDTRLLSLSFVRLNKIFGKINKVRLLGGEPLLHPDIINILNFSRNDLPYSQIELVTNGLLLDKMPEEFFLALTKNRISIEVTNYPPIQNKIKQIKDKLSSFNVMYSITPMVIDFTANLNPKGTSDQEQTFKNCRHTYCKILRDDNIYICPISAYIDKYNKYFNKNIPYPKGVNIYSNSARQILKKLKKSEQTCKYCTNVANYIPWGCSNNPKETDWNGKI